MTLRGQGTRGPGGVPLDTSGFPSFLWPVGFDPTVAPGVAAPVGSIGMLADGTAGWVKWYDGGDTGWVSFYDLGLMQFTFAPLLAQAGALGTLAGIQVALSDLASKQAALDAVAADQVAGARGLTQVSGNFGADAVAWDLAALACNTKGGFSVSGLAVFKGIGSCANLQVRINGTTVYAQLVGSYAAGFCPAAGGLLSTVITPDVTTPIGFTIGCDDPSPSRAERAIRLESSYISQGGYAFTYAGHATLFTNAEIDSVGVQITTPVNLTLDGALSKYLLTRRIAP